MKKIEVREALSALDIDTISMVAKEIWNEYFPSLIGQDQVDYMLEKFLSPGVLLEQMSEGYEIYFVYNEAGEGIGFYIIHPEEERLFLSKIYLYSDFRGQGYASAMFSEIEKRARELGLDRVYLTVNKHNDGPIGVYNHLGFDQIDSVVTDIGGGFVMDDYIMQKMLED